MTVNQRYTNDLIRLEHLIVNQRYTNDLIRLEQLTANQRYKNDLIRLNSNGQLIRQDLIALESHWRTFKHSAETA